MSKKQILVYCKKSDVRFGDVFFKKGQFYEANWLHDLLIFSGEKQNVIQIEHVTTNDYFQEYFTLVVSMHASHTERHVKSERISEKVRA